MIAKGITTQLTNDITKQLVFETNHITIVSVFHKVWQNIYHCNFNWYEPLNETR